MLNYMIDHRFESSKLMSNNFFKFNLQVMFNFDEIFLNDVFCDFCGWFDLSPLF